MKCRIRKDLANLMVEVYFYDDDSFYTETRAFPRSEYTTESTCAAYTVLSEEKYEILKETILAEEKPKKEQVEETGALAATRAHLNDLRGIVQYFLDKTKGNN